MRTPPRSRPRRSPPPRRRPAPAPRRPQPRRCGRGRGDLDRPDDGGAGRPPRSSRLHPRVPGPRHRRRAQHPPRTSPSGPPSSTYVDAARAQVPPAAGRAGSAARWRPARSPRHRRQSRPARARPTVPWSSSACASPALPAPRSGHPPVESRGPAPRAWLRWPWRSPSSSPACGWSSWPPAGRTAPRPPRPEGSPGDRVRVVRRPAVPPGGWRRGGGSSWPQTSFSLGLCCLTGCAGAGLGGDRVGAGGLVVEHPGNSRRAPGRWERALALWPARHRRHTGAVVSCRPLRRTEVCCFALVDPQRSQSGALLGQAPTSCLSGASGSDTAPVISSSGPCASRVTAGASRGASSPI